MIKIVYTDINKLMIRYAEIKEEIQKTYKTFSFFEVD